MSSLATNVSNNGRQLRAESPPPVVTGAFVQLTRESSTWDRASWDRQSQDMAKLGLDTLVVQYVASDNDYYYPSAHGGTSSNQVDTLGHLLAAAEQARIKVFLGLHLDHSFWQGKFDATERLQRNHATLAELWQRYRQSNALAGWYLPEEIDNLTAGREYSADLLKYLGSLSDQAHQLSRLPTMVSPYFGQKPDAAAYARWWDQVALPALHVDILALQDGVGTHRTSVAESREVFAALAPVLQRHKVAFWANNECFDQTHGWPVDDLAWSARPAPIETFLQQVKSTAPLVAKSITFEFCHYLDPERSAESRALYLGYLDYSRRRVMAGAHFQIREPSHSETSHDTLRQR